MEENGLVLTNCEVSSLVIDSLCDGAGGQNAAVACFYFDFAAQKEQSSTSMLGAVLKQVVGGLDEVPGEIARAYGDQRRVIGGRGPRLPMLLGCCKLPLPRSVHSFVLTLQTNAWQNIRSSFLVRLNKSSRSLRALEYS